jgi:peptidoglycan hydrolase CwlO-like protein
MDDKKNIEEDKRMIEKIALKIVKLIGTVGSVIVHTVIFTLAILLYAFNCYDRESIMLVVTTIVSLEAIYLSIFIQMGMNNHGKKLEEIKENVEDIQENVEDIQEDVEELNEEENDEDDEDDEDLKKIKDTLEILVKEIKDLKNKNKK